MRSFTSFRMTTEIVVILSGVCAAKNLTPLRFMRPVVRFLSYAKVSVWGELEGDLSALRHFRSGETASETLARSGRSKERVLQEFRNLLLEFFHLACHTLAKTSHGVEPLSPKMRLSIFSLPRF